MGNLTCSRHATYITLYLHTIYVKSREIHILSTIDNFIKPILSSQLQGAYKENIQTQKIENPKRKNTTQTQNQHNLHNTTCMSN